MTAGQKATADEYTSAAIDWFEEICTRFAGVDLQYRRHDVSWQAPWRARLVSNKNERSSYRITVYGESMYNAIVALRSAVEEADRQ